MRLRAFLIGLAICGGCRAATTPSPEIVSLDPASISPAAPAPVRILGKNFLNRVEGSLDGSGPITVDGEWDASVGVTALAASDVARVDDSEIDIVVPAGFAPGVYDVSVRSPSGQTATLVAGLTVGTPTPVPTPPVVAMACEPGNVTQLACYELDGNGADGSSFGIAVTTTAVTFAAGVDGMAAVLNAGSGIEAADAGQYSGSTSLTTELWVLPLELPAAGFLAALIDKSSQFSLYLMPGGEVECRAAGDTLLTAGAAITAYQWVHLACTYDGTNLRVYKNGVEIGIAPAAGSISSASTPLDLGEDSPNGENQLVGWIDSVRIWSVARTPAEICQAAGC